MMLRKSLLALACATACAVKDCGVSDVFVDTGWWTSDFDWSAASLQDCKTVSGLQSVPEQGIAALVAALAVDDAELISLDLRGAPLTDEVASALASSLVSNSVLERIDLRGAALSEDHGQTISAALTLGATGLKELAIDNDAVIPIDKLRGGFTHLNLARMGLGDAGAIVVFDLLATNEDLRELYVAFNRIGEAGGAAAARMIRSNSVLSVLALGHNRLGPLSGAAIGDALRVNTGLTHLSLDYNVLGDGGGRAIGEGLAENHGLDFLSVWSNGVGDATAAALGLALRSHERLATLQLDYNYIGESGGEALGLGVAATSAPLAVLTVHDNRLGDRAAAAIAEALKARPTLSELNLDHNAISEAGAKALAEGVWGSEGLTELSVDGNHFSSATHHRLEGLASLDPAERVGTAPGERKAKLNDAMGLHAHQDGHDEL